MKSLDKKLLERKQLDASHCSGFLEFHGFYQAQICNLSLFILVVASEFLLPVFLSQVVLTSMELLKDMAVGGGASSLQSVELQMSLEEMMEMY